MCHITKIFTMPSLTITETISFELDLTPGAFLGGSAQTSKDLLKEVLGRMFPAIYNLSIFSNDDLTNILATPLSAASDINP